MLSGPKLSPAWMVSETVAPLDQLEGLDVVLGRVAGPPRRRGRTRSSRAPNHETASSASLRDSSADWLRMAHTINPDSTPKSCSPRLRPPITAPMHGVQTQAAHRVKVRGEAHLEVDAVLCRAVLHSS